MKRIRGPGDVVTLEIEGKKIMAEVVMDTPSRNLGLMYRKPEDFSDDQGMLFIWPDKSDSMYVPSRPSFWMRNTEIPLSLAFIDDEGKIRQIEDLRPYDERRVVSKYEVRFALEVNQGWFQKNGIGPGSKFENFQEAVRGFRAR